MNSAVHIEYANGWTESDDYETPMKGYRNDVVVTTQDGNRYVLCFYDPVRLSQDVADEGDIIESNLVILNELSRLNIESFIYRISESKVLERIYKMSSVPR